MAPLRVRAFVTAKRTQAPLVQSLSRVAEKVDYNTKVSKAVLYMFQNLTIIQITSL